MKLTYDPTYNIAYIYFKEKQTDVDSIQIGDELVIDIASDGTIYGIELLNANEQLENYSFSAVAIDGSFSKGIKVTLKSLKPLKSFIAH